MNIIDQHAKKLMERCKDRARESGLRFSDETLEIILKNEEIVRLEAKGFIPTMYDYWVDEVRTLQGIGAYEIFPRRTYGMFEIVTNARPPISYYNVNNPDWLNVMIFYHVLAHIDFFQNNAMFRNTWRDDFAGQALADKRTIAKLRREHGRWLEYTIEFARAIDNLVGFHAELAKSMDRTPEPLPKAGFYFDVFIQGKDLPQSEFFREMELYNRFVSEDSEQGEQRFFALKQAKYPELGALYERYRKEWKQSPSDAIEFIMQNSPFLNKAENEWMKQVIEIVRRTSLYFQPQIKTKIMNEGWASYWHEQLFMQNERISGHEVQFAVNNAQITALNRLGLNPYAVGLRLFQYIEEQADQGRLSHEFKRLRDITARDKYDQNTGNGKQSVFDVREQMDDFLFIHLFLDQDFVDRHKLFVSERRFNPIAKRWEYYVKSRKAEDYKRMVTATLYHPPSVTAEDSNGTLSLHHHFEGQRLVPEYIQSTMVGIAHLWGGTVTLRTYEPTVTTQPSVEMAIVAGAPRVVRVENPQATWQAVRYTANDKKVTKEALTGERELAEVAAWFSEKR
ncbi:SpoVR family protein [Candidatus Woesearchaeota archaeon]|nr:SpoVR family protein [Candidatus Woesearchaeota archaeon]